MKVAGFLFLFVDCCLENSDLRAIKSSTMKKRDFIKLSGIVGTGIVISPLMACNEAEKKTENNDPADNANSLPVQIFELPALGFAFNALEPSIDALTMEIHHDKHHGGYVKKLNAALEGNADFGGMNLEAIMANVNAEDTGVRNNGGGHYNHSLFWTLLNPGGANAASGELLDAINADFGSYDAFLNEFSAAAKTRFGSGWAWLSMNQEGRLFVSSTPNQDNPLMANIVEEKGTPIMGIDVWEHAYYLNYQNKRADYIQAFLSILNWDVVAKNYTALK